MSERAWLAAMVIGVAALAVPTGLGAAEPEPKAVAPLILNLTNRPVESRERAYTEDIKRDALAPRPSGIDEWEPQPDGSMRNKKTGISVRVINPCPAGDIDHEFALAAYNRSRSRR
ncbi:MAG TPA: hypothetical protein VKA83_25930 [Methylomirabilota bacterium]|jgi:hypothetical protein|nr:hypothetical protein [Methylomirabilota bacterium]